MFVLMTVVLVAFTACKKDVPETPSTPADPPSVPTYPLSGSYTINRLCGAMSGDLMLQLVASITFYENMKVDFTLQRTQFNSEATYHGTYTHDGNNHGVMTLHVGDSVVNLDFTLTNSRKNLVTVLNAGPLFGRGGNVARFFDTLGDHVGIKATFTKNNSSTVFGDDAFRGSGYVALEGADTVWLLEGYTSVRHFETGSENYNAFDYCFHAWSPDAYFGFSSTRTPLVPATYTITPYPYAYEQSLIFNFKSGGASVTSGTLTVTVDGPEYYFVFSGKMDSGADFSGEYTIVLPIPTLE